VIKDVDEPMSAWVDAVLAKMRGSGAHALEVAALERRLEQLVNPGAGLVPGEVLEPVDELPRLEDLSMPGLEEARRLLDRVAIVKVNGGLGTSMGMTGPKSLLEVKPGLTFLDIVVKQVLALRSRYACRLPLVLMNSQASSKRSMEFLERNLDIKKQNVPLEFMQGKEPKIRADTFFPIDWPIEPGLEWCPPGHGDIYVALAVSGILDRLLDAGIRWCYVSNADNLGAQIDVRIVRWIARRTIPFVMEAVRGTAADRKGGHLARREGRLIVRESAQVPPDDTSVGDVERWRFYNTNNLWIDLHVLRGILERSAGGPALPLIVNRKTVDPSDHFSTPVIQLETAMAGAIGLIEGAMAVEVPRSRFVPVKTTDDLVVVRSDAYELGLDGLMNPKFAGDPPVVSLSREYYGLIRDFSTRFPAGPPSLRLCKKLDVEGDVTFGSGVSIEGTVKLVGARQVKDGAVLRG